MADHKPIVQLFLDKEGGMSRAKTDKASKNPAPFTITYKGTTASDWHTNKGVTWTTFKQLADKLGYRADAATFAAMPMDVWTKIFRAGYWNPWGLDKMRSNIMAWVIVWWSWGSGIEGARKSLVKFLGKKGIAAESKADIVTALDNLAARQGDSKVFMDLREHRLEFYQSLDTAAANYKGWKNAYDKFTEWVKTNGGAAAMTAAASMEDNAMGLTVALGLLTGALIYRRYKQQQAAIGKATRRKRK